MNIPTFKESLEKGTIVEKSGYHQPDIYKRNDKLTTDKGAYKDAIVKMPTGETVYIYHKTPIVVKKDGKYVLNNGGYETSSTKQRINQYCPFHVYQEDFTWYVNYKDEKLEFKNGMVLEQ